MTTAEISPEQVVIPDPQPLADDIVTIPEIAYMTGFTRAAVERWRLRTKGGEPVLIVQDDYVGSAPVWRLERLIAWLESTGRKYDLNAWRAARADGEFLRRQNKTEH